MLAHVALTTEERIVPVEKPQMDYTAMSGPEMLNAVRDDAMRWAEAFCQMKKKWNWRLEDIDEGLMVGWFANAIEHSDMTRQKARNEIPPVRNPPTFNRT